MFILLKKRNILIGLLIVALTVGLCFAVTATATSAYSVPKLGKTVVIDAGHGGVDGGVVGVNTRTKESDINLSIARSLQHFLKTKGYTVVMTRTIEQHLHLDHILVKVGSIVENLYQILLVEEGFGIGVLHHLLHKLLIEAVALVGIVLFFLHQSV